MIRFLTRKTLFSVIGLCLGLLLFCSPAYATTYSFQSPGSPGEEGVLTGTVTFDADAVRDALKRRANQTLGVSSLLLEDLGKDSQFSFEYVSPHSGVKHTEDTICDRYVYDIGSGLAGNDITGNEIIGNKEGPFFDFASSSILASVDLKSCVGKKGDIYSSISKRDPLVAFSGLELQFNRLNLVEEDYSGGKPGLYRKKLPIKFTLKEP
ncbi:MAG: hypothetical protein AAGG51_29465 [Cyanobacteria bacterium P01_G01_bin.54]